MAISRMQQPRQMYQEGGIMPRLNQLGSGVSSAEQMLQGINQRLESAESNLGESDGEFSTTQPKLNLPPIDSFLKPDMQGSTLSSTYIGNSDSQQSSPIAAFINSGGFGGEGVGDPRLGAPFIPGNPLQQIMRGARADGGLMGRQNYGLGSFVKKAVKGVTKGIKSIAKSDLGKAAIIGGLGMYAGGLGPFASGSSMFGGKLAGLKGAGFLKNITGGGILDAAKNFLGGEKTFGKTLGVMAGGTLLGGLLAKAEEGDEEAIAATRNVGALRSYLDKGYRNLGYKEDEIPALVEEGVAEYTSAQGAYAAGGRVKFGNGSDDKSEMVKRVEELMDDGYDFGSAVKKYMEETRDKEAMGGRIGYDIGSSPIRNMAIKMNSGRGPITKKDYIDIYEMAGYDKDVATSLGTKHYKTGRGQDSKTQGLKNGGRIGYEKGTPEMGMIDPKKVKQAQTMIKMGSDVSTISSITGLSEAQVNQIQQTQGKANGGRIGYAFGNKPEQNAIEAAGIEGLPLNQNPAGVTELDLRETGGFIPPVGVKEKADDIPAMLANNEFVFTADAVRGMGDGNVNKGAQRMYDMMKKLEKGGRV